MKAILLNVSQRDIEIGRRKNPCECPIACALTRKFAHTDTPEKTRNMGHRVLVRATGEIEIPFRGTWAGDDTIQRWIERFDAGLGVRPAEFLLRRIDA